MQFQKVFSLCGVKSAGSTLKVSRLKSTNQNKLRSSIINKVSILNYDNVSFKELTTESNKFQHLFLNANEFLSLACNSKNRIELMTNSIKTNMKLNKLEFSVNLIVNSKTKF